MYVQKDISKQLDNALLACSNGPEESVIKAIEYQATNPFLIYPSDYVKQEDLISIIAREKGYSKKEITRAIKSLLSRGALRKRRNIFAGGSYAVTNLAVSGNIVPFS